MPTGPANEDRLIDLGFCLRHRLLLVHLEECDELALVSPCLGELRLLIDVATIAIHCGGLEKPSRLEQASSGFGTTVGSR